MKLEILQLVKEGSKKFEGKWGIEVERIEKVVDDGSEDP